MKINFTKEKFVNGANKLHNNFYSYEKTIYFDCFTEIIITCPIHGDFLQTPKSHMRKRGCKKCGLIRQSEGQIKLRMPFEKFIERAIFIHNNKYDYSKVKYGMTNKKIEIICPLHGSFWKLPHKHLAGRGCRKCSDSTGEKTIVKILNKNKILFEPQKTFESCRYKRKLAFDFFLPDYNTLIEFDGQTHYEDVYGLDVLERTQIRDKFKNNWTLENNIRLLRIPYYLTDKIEDIILSFIK